MKDIKIVLQELENEALRDNIPIIRAEERERFISAIKTLNPIRILEIGTAIGYSSLLLLSKFPSAVIDTVELNKTRYVRARRAACEAGVASRWNGYCGDASDILPILSNSYDVVFLDGPKGQYLRQLKMIEPLLATQAIVIADNVLFRGLVTSDKPIAHKYRTIVMRLREYINYVKTYYDTVIDESGDGLCISRKK